MKYYTYSGRKSQSRMKSNRKRVIWNVVIIIILIAACAVFALFLGNHLKNKLDTSGVSEEPVEEIIPSHETSEPAPEDRIDLVKNNRAEGEMSAIYGYLDIDGAPDVSGAEHFVSALSGSGYGGFVFCVRNSQGKYAYASRAVSDLRRTAMPSGVIPYANLGAAIATASSLGMRSCAYIDLTDTFSAYLYSDDTSGQVGYDLDRAVIKELAELGFSEIILDGLVTGGSLTVDYATSLYGFVSEIRTNCPGTDIGLVINEDILADHESTAALELVFRFVDHFALDLRNGEEYTPEAVASLVDKFSGSFNGYSICVLRGGSSLEEISSSIGALSILQHPSIAFLTPREDRGETVKDTDDPFAPKLEVYSITTQQGTADDAAVETDEQS